MEHATFSSETGPVHGDIFAGSSDVITDSGTLAAAQGAVVRGQVLAVVSGQYVKHNPAGSGGAEVAKAIAAFPASTGEGVTANIGVYVAGEFDEAKLTWAAATDTWAERKAAFPVGSPIVIKRTHFSA